MISTLGAPGGRSSGSADSWCPDPGRRWWSFDVLGTGDGRTSGARRRRSGWLRSHLHSLGGSLTTPPVRADTPMLPRPRGRAVGPPAMEKVIVTLRTGTADDAWGRVAADRSSTRAACAGPARPGFGASRYAAVRDAPDDADDAGPAGAGALVSLWTQQCNHWRPGDHRAGHPRRHAEHVAAYLVTESALIAAGADTRRGGRLAGEHGGCCAGPPTSMRPPG